MPKVFLQLVSKSGSLMGEKSEFHSDVIPRAGELIDAGAILKKLFGQSENPIFFVESVIYEATENGFVAYITASNWYKGFRDEMLMRRGWLPFKSDHQERSYDEEDPAWLYE